MKISAPWMNQICTYQFSQLDIANYTDPNLSALYFNAAQECCDKLLKIPGKFEFFVDGKKVSAIKIRSFWNAKVDSMSNEIPFLGNKKLTYRTWNKPSGDLGGFQARFPEESDEVMYLFENIDPDFFRQNSEQIFSAAGEALSEKYKEFPKKFFFPFEQKLLTADLQSITPHSSSIPK